MVPSPSMINSPLALKTAHWKSNASLANEENDVLTTARDISSTSEKSRLLIRYIVTRSTLLAVDISVAINSILFIFVSPLCLTSVLLSQINNQIPLRLPHVRFRRYNDRRIVRVDQYRPCSSLRHDFAHTSDRNLQQSVLLSEECFSGAAAISGYLRLLHLRSQPRLWNRHQSGNPQI